MHMYIYVSLYKNGMHKFMSVYICKKQVSTRYEVCILTDPEKNSRSLLSIMMSSLPPCSGCVLQQQDPITNIHTRHTLARLAAQLRIMARNIMIQFQRVSSLFSSDTLVYTQLLNGFRGAHHRRQTLVFIDQVSSFHLMLEI